MNKKIFLGTLLGLGIFLGFGTQCRAQCYKDDFGRLVCTGAAGEGKDSASNPGSCVGKDSCWNGASNSAGTIITVNPVPDSNLVGLDKLQLTNSELNELGVAGTISGTSGNPQHAEDWKKEISGLGSVISGRADASPMQKKLIDELAKANGMTVEQFKEAYISQVTNGKNNDAFTYIDTPVAEICDNYGKCQWFSSETECRNAGLNYACAAARWASDSCGKVACTGYDKGQIRIEQSCMERLNDAYACCVEAYGEDACNPKKTPNTPIAPGTCDPVETEPKTYSPRVLIEEGPYGSIGCGNTYTTYSYEYGTTSCNLVSTLITTVTTEEYPGIYGTYNAGDQFDFSNTVYWHSTKTETVWDDSPLKNEQADARSVLSSLQSQRACLQKEISKLNDAISKLTCDGGYYDNQCISTCIPGDKNCGSRCYVPEDCSSRDSLARKYESDIKKLEQQIGTLEPQIANAQKRIDELNDCSEKANSFRSTSSSSSGSYTLSGTYLSLDKYTQPIDSIKGIAKNSGQLLTQNELNSFKFPYFTVSSNFVIPIGITNGTAGEVVAGGNLYSCPINVRNLLIVDCSKGNCNSGGLNVIYRPISLTNPFPNLTSNGQYRAMGANWNETYAETVVKNNRGVSTYEVYNQTPIYTIELTAAKIKEIRKYNKETSFNNFDMNCTDGYLCTSNFLWGTTANGYSFSDIVVQSESCATSNGWDACYGGAS